MSATKMTKSISLARMLLASTLALFLATAAHAAVPGITGPTFNLTAQPAFLNQPDGNTVYSWGYGCDSTKPAPSFAPAAITTATCPTMQVPGPTLIVHEGDTVTVNLANGLPLAAGNTSILFPGFVVTSTGGTPGLMTQEAAPAGAVTYTFIASSPGTHAYYSGTQGDLQVEMGLYGAVVVLPKTIPAACSAGLPVTNPGANAAAKSFWKETDFRLAPAAFDSPKSCYDREYLFQWAEMDPRIHNAALAQVTFLSTCTPVQPGCGDPLVVPTEPYHPAYFLINGRSMPDLMDPNFAAEYPHQPYNGNPHMHPGEMTLIRSIGQGRWQHPFHEHANHVRILGRDGNMILAPDGSSLAGQLMFNTDTTPGEAFDGIFYFTGRGLNWDAYGHHPNDTADSAASLSCTPDANGYNTGAPTAINYFEWCQDHNKPVEVAPIGDVAAGGPVTLPNPNIFTNGAWYGGTPYLGPDATVRGGGTQACLTNGGTTSAANATTTTCSTLQPFNTQANPASERGWAYMWHSHNEREITTNNVFPGGMLMMMLVDSREFVIDESN
jgi:FtsP/CotA-like multicopper oxidase with cupredoxin domain